jgi:hypothetical protein
VQAEGFTKRVIRFFLSFAPGNISSFKKNHYK